MEGLGALIVMGIRLLAMSVMDGVGNSMGLTLWFAGHIHFTTPSCSTSRSLVCFIADQHDPRLAQEVYVLSIPFILLHAHFLLYSIIPITSRFLVPCFVQLPQQTPTSHPMMLEFLQR